MIYDATLVLTKWLKDNMSAIESLNYDYTLNTENKVSFSRASIQLEKSTRLSSITVWGSGSAELMIFDATNKDKNKDDCIFICDKICETIPDVTSLLNLYILELKKYDN